MNLETGSFVFGRAIKQRMECFHVLLRDFRYLDVSSTLGVLPNSNKEINHVQFLKKMFNIDEEKIECEFGNREFCFWQCKKAENGVFIFLTSRLLNVSDSWYCQIQTQD